MRHFPFPPYHSNVPHFGERVATYCARVLPLVFDNSLSYYEFLGHMQCKLNEVIKALNSQNLVFVEFTHMIELELQNFEEYMDDRQQNFETEMQEEWTAFKSELETAWNEFKTQLESEWTAEKALNETFRTNMQNAFQNFQTLITTQQTTFETALRNQQNQFQTDMTSRQNTFEDTMEDNFEQWKVDTLAALQAGIQRFEQDALAAITAAMPGVVQDLTEQTYIPSGTGSENPISGTGVADALLSTVPTMVDSLTQQIYLPDNHHPISGMGVADLVSRLFTLLPYYNVSSAKIELYALTPSVSNGLTGSDLRYFTTVVMNATFIIPLSDIPEGRYLFCFRLNNATVDPFETRYIVDGKVALQLNLRRFQGGNNIYTICTTSPLTPTWWNSAPSQTINGVTGSLFPLPSLLYQP